ncbi:MAG: cysteine protease StiP family protein [Gemmataceae bacterium]|nr:cysteine protease StiP family protein [Gemmataceae bacterium]MCI0740889.1 cysteine protease StiP family protein [Gemmataceae bacterium]
MFSGSYDPEDVVFLLKPARIEPTPVALKERLIQSGQRHYSEMLSAEGLPSPQYLRVFHEALERAQERFARHLLTLARIVSEARPAGDITLVSLARAGTPIGAIVGRILRRLLCRKAIHYSISIIRDRGIDEVALAFILSRHPADSIAFVDGWTGKGVIARELHKSITAFNEKITSPTRERGNTIPTRERGNIIPTREYEIDPGLFTVADLSGTAKAAATAEDYLIPSSVLGCTISGLVSRSVLNEEVVGPGDLHACLFYEEFKPHDLSRWFVDRMFEEAASMHAVPSPPTPLPTGRGECGRQTEQTVPGISAAQQAEWRDLSTTFLQDMQKRFNIRDLNHVKPGIGEATRVLLRRVPDRLLLRDPDEPDVAHLRVLAQEKNVPTLVDPSLPYRAAALIEEMDG